MFFAKRGLGALLVLLATPVLLSSACSAAASGTLVVMPVDASGNVGAVALTHGPFVATQNADVLAAY